ncbi:MAG: prolyl oligopeptidase family serine peptidase, partial [Actinomycetota bacterium]|nr:prolyl oligopeptidase family serine peptidase [Actinomycetota bacterium]
AFVCAQALHVTEVGASQRAARLVGEDDAAVSWGLAEFVAAEELGRTRGFWWSPSSDRLLVARVDSAEVQRWHLAEPAEPARPPGTLAYPAAGTANARVTLAVVALDGSRTPVDWDVAALPYLVDALWTPDGPLTVVVQSRDQRTVQVLTVDPATGATTVVRTDHDERWVDIVAGVPRWLGDGRLVHTVDRDDTRRLALDGDPITPPSLEIRQVVTVGEDSVVATASEADPTAVGVWRVPTGGGDPEPVSTDHGVHSAAGTPGLLVVQSRDLQTDGVRTVVHGADGPVAIASRAERPGLVPRVRLLSLGRRELRSALLLPRGYADADGPLPVLLDPYGGPHAQRVLRSRDAFLVSQWFADAGFAVLVTDGRGTPGRGPAWERAVWGDLASAPLTDQVDALHAVAERHPLDLHRVAIRGWSFGGYLAALAVLRRPDVFHAAIAGAPVTDWRLYDTHYTERYLGLPEPDDQSGPYARSSLLADAPRLERPLLLIHGLADDNVVAAHTLRLSRALLEAGRPHQVLPLSGVTHMTPQEAVAESLLLLQLDFLHRALGMPGDPTETEPGRPRGRPAAAAESSPARGRPERAGPEL